jgi:phage FluMu protein Com
MDTFSITCAQCGTVNRLVVAGEVLSQEKISCSKCNHVLGTWDSLTSTRTGEADDSASQQSPN